MRRRTRAASAALLGLALAWPADTPPRAQQVGTFSPFIGETLQEFESRKQGGGREKASVRGTGAVTVASDRRGHFVVHPKIDGNPVKMMVDTGASLVALSYEDAEQSGFRVEPQDFTRRFMTANGVVEAAPVRIAEIQVGDITIRDVEAAVLPKGRLGTSLLGMTFLTRLSGFEVAGGKLKLTE